MKSIWLLVFAFAAFATTNSHAVEPTGRYLDIVNQMKAVQTNHSGFVSMFSLGANDDGVEIYALRISTTPTNMDPQKAGHLVVATHHGNEVEAATFAIDFINDLVARYESSELYRGRLSDIEWTVVPVLNVSGYNAKNRYEHGQDPNRDYPGPCVTGEGGRLKSIRQVMNLLNSRVFAGSLTVHGYAGAMTYPWGVNVDDTRTKDDNRYSAILAKAASLNGYSYGTSTDIVYPCDGAFEDFVYWRHGIWSLLLELKSGSASDRKMTVPAIAKYFDELDASPSVQNQLTSQCHSAGRLDLGRE
jgi:carboxypeptidase T